MTVEVDYLTSEAPVPDPITGAVDGAYSLNADHEAEAISHLIQFFREGPRNQAVLAAIMAQVQELEDENWALHGAFDIDTAVGDQLDLLGKLVGEGRQDRLDAEYRTAVRVRILVNGSDGRMSQLIAIGEGISPTANILTRELYPAAMSMEFDTFGSATLRSAYRLLSAAKPAGVRLHLIQGLATPALGSSDGSPAGGVLGSSDGSPAGFVLGSGT